MDLFVIGSACHPPLAPAAALRPSCAWNIGGSPPCKLLLDLADALGQLLLLDRVRLGIKDGAFEGPSLSAVILQRLVNIGSGGSGGRLSFHGSVELFNPRLR
eukprot:5231418-Pyramimonas_sp.AAC.1